MTGDDVLCKNWYLLGEKKFMPCPQNRNLVPLRGSFQNFWQAPPSFLCGNTPPGLQIGYKMETSKDANLKKIEIWEIPIFTFLALKLVG